MKDKAQKLICEAGVELRCCYLDDAGVLQQHLRCNRPVRCKLLRPLNTQQLAQSASANLKRASDRYIPGKNTEDKPHLCLAPSSFNMSLRIAPW
jgi:hypothetical protein